MRVEVEEDPVVREGARGVRREFRASVKAWQEDSGAWVPVQGRVLVRLEGTEPNVAYGDTLEVEGFAARPEPPANPGQFDYAGWLEGQGIRHVVQVAEGRTMVVERGGGWAVVRWSVAFRHYMQRTLRLGLEEDSMDQEASALMAGMLFGFRDGISEPLKHAFRVTGTMHLFAVSGQNVGIILAMLLLVLQMAGVIRWRWGWLMLPMVLVFCLSTGMEASAFRAFVMAGLATLGWALYRPVGLFNILGAAALVMWVWDPTLALDLGFQLSFCVVMGIGWLAGPLTEAARPWGAPDPWIPQRLVPWWRRQVFALWTLWCGLAAVSVAAWVASLPLTLWHFHLFSPVALLANVIIVPLATVVLVLSALSVTLGALWEGFAAAANGLSALVLRLVIVVVGQLAALPGGHWYVGRPGSGPEGDAVRLTVLHHGQAAPGVVEWQGRAWLLDPGPEAAWRYVTDPFRMFRGIDRWEGVVLSHGGTRRLGSARLVLEEMSVGWWAESGWRSRSRAQHVWLEAMALAQVPKQFWRRGDRLEWAPPIQVEVLHPGREEPGVRLEDRGLVLRMVMHGQRVLWAGDISQETEAELLASGQDVRAEVLVQGEHPVDPGPGRAWLEAVQPRFIIRPGRGYQPDRGLTPEFWADVERLGIRVLRQDRHGAVILDCLPAEVRVRGFR
jgi:competence protein ComEC